MQRIIIARHGNTFKKGETPTRVGGRTDLPLVESHLGESIGKYLKANNIIPNKIFAAPLLRTTQTAQLVAKELNYNDEIIKNQLFTEIDYGPDENKTEDEVMLRLGKGNMARGKDIIDAWNKLAVVPDGWSAKPEEIKKNWINFADTVKDETVLLVTSNGIMRFAPVLTGNFDEFCQNNDIKVSTGGVCIFEKDHKEKYWNCTAWNLRPAKQ